MNIDWMRQVDHWIGIPLCFFLTLIHGIVKLFPSKGREEGAPQKILFIKPSEIGGIILAYPLMKKIKEEYPDARLFFLTFTSNKEVFEALDIVPEKNIFTIENKSFLTFALDTIKTIFRLRKERIDISFDLEFFSRFTAIVSFLSGAKKRIGLSQSKFRGLYRGKLLTKNIEYNPNIHTSKLFLSMKRALDNNQGLSSDIVLPKFTPQDDLRTKVRKLLNESGVDENAKIYFVSLGEGWIPLREWPLDNFFKLCRRILENENSCIVMVGSQRCKKKTEDFCKTIGNKRCIDLSGKTSVCELLTLFSLGDALIANDSGIAHLAALTSIPAFVLFGPESPSIFSPLGGEAHVFYKALPCSPCLSAYNHRRSDCRNNICLKTISPEDVYAAIADKFEF